MQNIGAALASKLFVLSHVVLHTDKMYNSICNVITQV